MLGFQVLRFFILVRSEATAPCWIFNPEYNPKFDWLYHRFRGKGYGGMSLCILARVLEACPWHGWVVVNVRAKVRVVREVRV